MKSIYIIRHGQSLANTGAESMPDQRIPLTDLGLEQAQSLIRNWQMQVDVGQLPLPISIYHSELLRAKQTAQVFADHFSLSLEQQPLLNELCCLGFSTVQGMIGKERTPLAQHYWQTADINYRDAKDADTFAEFLARVDSFIKIAPSLSSDTLLFGHGIWIGLLAYRLLGCQVKSNSDIQKFRQFQTAIPMHNTVVYRLDMGTDRLMQLQVIDISVD